MNPAFTIKLDQQVLSGLVVTGKFDGKVPSIACATTGGKILIHSPHDVTNTDGQLSAIRYLNLNRKITALAAGALPKESETNSSDLLFVGSQSNLLGYDLERNADAFFVDVQDGVHSLVVGKIGNSPKPLVIAGGNCSVLGFDNKGTESFWTVTGDNVSAMALCDLNSSGKPLLLVGSDDFEIRVFQQEELLNEITEADKVTHLKPIGNGSKFAYGLANGTVGVYSGIKNRVWRVKTKNKATALESYDLDMDGVPEIFSGWDNGMITVRREENGEVVFRQNMDAPVAAILKADYRMDGKEEVMICSESGEIRAYLASDVDLSTVAGNGLVVGKETSADQKALAELQSQKLELMAEMKLLERSLNMTTKKEVPVGMLPHGTALSYSLEGDLQLGAVALRVEVNTDCQIMNLIAVDLEGVVLADREVIAVSPRPGSRTAVLPLRPVKFSPCTLRIQTHVASRSLNTLLHVFETTLQLPRFSSFKYLESPGDFRSPTSHVTFDLKDSLDRVLSWVQTSFLTPRLVKNADGNQKLFFVATCRSPLSGDNSAGGRYNTAVMEPTEADMLVISIQNITDGGQSHLRIKIKCESMDLAAELVQDMTRYFKLEELQSEAEFPVELQLFEEVVNKVADCNSARVNLTADMADDSQRIKALVIRAEDARLMNDMPTMRRAYTELNSLNEQLIASYNVRAQNQANLLTSLKEVNQMIQRAANLRMGKAKARVITDCRAAVKANNMKSLFRIIQQGYDPSKAPAKSSSSHPKQR